jgi:hypothetical protein
MMLVSISWWKDNDFFYMTRRLIRLKKKKIFYMILMGWDYLLSTHSFHKWVWRYIRILRFSFLLLFKLINCILLFFPFVFTSGGCHIDTSLYEHLFRQTQYAISTLFDVVVLRSFSFFLCVYMYYIFQLVSKRKYIISFFLTLLLYPTELISTNISRYI